jgi:hypothetical protein
MGSRRADTPDGGWVFTLSAHESESMTADKLAADSETGNEEIKTD